MKLTLLEDGVLDYKGPGRVLATPEGLPIAGLSSGVKPAPPRRELGKKEKLKNHIESCPACSDTLCSVGEKLANSL